MKQIVFALVCAFLSLASACEDATSPTDSKGLSNPVFKRDIANPGKLHNEIARVFAARLADLGDEPVTRKQFVKLMVDATNETFRAQGLPSAVTSADINVGLNEVMDLHNRKVFDFFSCEPGDPAKIIDDWERRGIVSHADADGVRARLRKDPDVYSSPASKALRGFDSVYFASMELWSDPTFKLKNARRQLDDEPPNKDTLRWDLDSIFFLLGMLLSGGTAGTVVGTAVSLVFDMLPPADLGSWDCSDYCNMG
jgi:hypothetical protein